jgi:hypothetical protein
VIYEYEVPGGTLNLNSPKLPRPWSPGGSSPSRKNPHGRTGNRTRDLMISSQKLWPLDHNAGLITNYILLYFTECIRWLINGMLTVTKQFKISPTVYWIFPAADSVTLFDIKSYGRITTCSNRITTVTHSQTSCIRYNLGLYTKAHR